MGRRVFPLTLDVLIQEAINAKERFGGDKYVFLSDDEEGNGYHECYFTFSNAKECFEGCAYEPFGIKPEDCVVLG